MIAIAAVLTSCNDYETYGEKKEKERNAISEYISKNNITVISEDKFKEQGQQTNVEKNEFVRQGKRAMSDAMGRASAMSGGYASSYAESLGHQAYAEQLGKLSEMIPELYDRARKDYDAETERLMKNVEQALGFYDSDYQTYLNAMEADREALAFEAENERWNKEFQNDNDHWEREFQNENSHWSQEFNTENAHWDKEFKQRQKEWNDRVAAGLHGAGDAYALAMLSLMQGEPVSDELLEAAGLDPEFAEQLRRYYANVQG